jgi:hypothetical protein
MGHMRSSSRNEGRRGWKRKESFRHSARAAPRGNRPVRSLADREGGEVEGATDVNHIDKGSLR